MVDIKKDLSYLHSNFNLVLKVSDVKAWWKLWVTNMYKRGRYIEEYHLEEREGTKLMIPMSGAAFYWS